MSQTMAWIDLDTVIAQYMDEAELSIHKQVKLKQIAYRGIEQMGLDAFWRIQSTLIPINPNLTVNLPANCVRLIKVGVLNENGGVIALKKDDNLTTYADYLSNRETIINENAVFNWNLSAQGTWYNFWNGYSYVNFYGVPSGSPFVGTYTVDEYKGLVVLGTNLVSNLGSVVTSLLVECVVSPDLTQPCKIPIQFKEALIAYMAWRDIVNLPSTRRGGLSDKRDRKHEFYNQRRLAIARYKAFDQNDANQISIQNIRQTIKG